MLSQSASRSLWQSLRRCGTHRASPLRILLNSATTLGLESAEKVRKSFFISRISRRKSFLLQWTSTSRKHSSMVDVYSELRWPQILEATERCRWALIDHPKTSWTTSSGLFLWPWPANWWSPSKRPRLQSLWKGLPALFLKRKSSGLRQGIVF